MTAGNDVTDAKGKGLRSEAGDGKNSRAENALNFDPDLHGSNRRDGKTLRAYQSMHQSGLYRDGQRAKQMNR